ncbi:MAG: aminopeptidase P family protein [Acidimicrobiales bacterium]
MADQVEQDVEQDVAPEGTATHDPNTPEALVAFMSTDWAPPVPLATALAPVASHTVVRRTALSARFPGEWLVVPTGVLKVRANDTDHPFRPGSDHYWLTGSFEPYGVLVMAPTPHGHDSTLFVPPRMDRSTKAFFADRRYGELWVGPRLGLEAEVLLGVACAPIEELEAALKRADGCGVRVLRGLDPEVDAAIAPVEMEPAEESTETDNSEEGESEEKLHPDAELAQVLSELRLVKDEHEVQMLQKAVDATARGFDDAVRELAVAKRWPNGERWIEGTFWRRARAEGNDVGYGSIVACGTHACTLHWVDNSGAVRDGDLALLDMGIESVELYTADVTRTIPISGRFTDVQREVYDAVHQAQLAALAEVRPGAEFLDPHKAAMRVLTQWLVERGILRCTVEEALDEEHMFHRRYTLHSTSHMLGLDVHDCASARSEMYRKGTLIAGTCLTVEPGLYFQPDDLTVPERYRGIGVRIEDDVLVTPSGRRNLSASIPSKADEVEAWMADLQR